MPDDEAPNEAPNEAQDNHAHAEDDPGAHSNTVAVGAVANAWYGRMVGLPDAARARAQNAYAITSAVAAGVIGAAVLTNIKGQPVWVRSAGLAGLTLWLIAAAAYVVAVSTPPPDLPPDIEGTDAWLAAVARVTKTERTDVGRRLQRANVIAIVAAVVSLVALGGIIFPGTTGASVTLELTSPEQASLSVVCGHPVTAIQGTVDTSTLTATEIVIRPSNCPTATKLLVPSSAITAVRYAPRS